MTNLTTRDPRFLPVTFNGRTYITSTLLHKQKREGGMSKYERADNFMKMIREIDCFERLVENGDIIEVTKSSMKSSNLKIKSDEITGLFSELLKANYNNPLMLISPTAQKEIEHFLDDEQSKDSAVQSSQVSAILGGGYGLESAGKLIDLLYGNYKQLETQNLQLAQERDHAIETKAHINDKKIASVLGQWGHLKAELKKHKLPTEAKTQIKQKAKKVADSLATLDSETQTRVQAMVKTEAPKPVYVDAHDWFRAQKQISTIHELPPEGTISLWRFLYLHTGISFSLTFEAQYEAAMAMAETEFMFIVESQTKPSNGAPPKTVFTPYFFKGAYDEYFINQDLLGHLKATLGKLVYKGVDVPGDLFTAHPVEIPPDHIEF